uniref:Uncharacterized protein n=1 Tax=Arundo donax TaxID=35708 RepID=A0A0A9H341_ARUDO
MIHCYHHCFRGLKLCPSPRAMERHHLIAYLAT